MRVVRVFVGSQCVAERVSFGLALAGLYVGKTEKSRDVSVYLLKLSGVTFDRDWRSTRLTH